MTFYGNFGQTHGASNWRDMLHMINQGRAEYGHMSAYPDTPQYLKDAASASLRAKVNQYSPQIERGVIDEYNGLVDRFAGAREGERRAAVAEIRRWDSNRLAGEISLAQLLVNNALQTDTPDKVLQALQEEARASGDIHKQRAVAEVVRGSLAMVQAPEKRMLVNRAVQKAQEELAGLRSTPETVQAGQVASAAFDAVQAKIREMREIQETIGASRALDRAQRRVQIDQTGQITILSRDDPQVTGASLYQVAGMGG